MPIHPYLTISVPFHYKNYLFKITDTYKRRIRYEYNDFLVTIPFPCMLLVLKIDNHVKLNINEELAPQPPLLKKKGTIKFARINHPWGINHLNIN